MPNPLIAQGQLNRLRANLVISGLSVLNVTPSYMGKRMLSVAQSGSPTTMIDTATGRVTSPEPYIPVDITVPLLRTQALAAAWINQIINVSSVFGNVNIYPDSSQYPTMNVLNTGITRWGEVTFSGEDPVVQFILSGYLPINNSLWDAS